VQYGKCVYKPDRNWSDDSALVIIITYNKATHAAELTKYLKFDDSVDTNIRASITTIITEFWDCFVKEGAQRTILGYKFGIDTGGSKSVCCHTPCCGSYKPKVIMEQII